MKLQKQLFTAFLTVAILPLFVVALYTFAVNVMLAFDLYGQNLSNSTEIQADMVNDDLNRLMVRSKRFASSRAVRSACADGVFPEGYTNIELSNEILKFTDETLDSVCIFALYDNTGNLLYSSGSNSDTHTLKQIVGTLNFSQVQSVFDLNFGDQGNTLLIDTPIVQNEKMLGSFLVVYRSDHFLKMISSHRQMTSSNALIYSMSDRQVVVSKSDLPDDLEQLDQVLSQNISEQPSGNITSRLGNQDFLIYYRTLPKTPWVLVSTVPVTQVFSRIWNYGLVSIVLFALVVFAILALSRTQSRRMLRPLEQLLSSVEQFYLEGAAQFPKTNIDPKTELGYLNEKFSRMSQEVSLAQGQLRESNYLYEALLGATYDFRLIADLRQNTLSCSAPDLSKYFSDSSSIPPLEQLKSLLLLEQCQEQALDSLTRIFVGQIIQPEEVEVCFQPPDASSPMWYRIIAVPVTRNQESASRVVLHFENITQTKQEQLRLLQSSQTDPLCGLLNKTAFPLHCKPSPPGKTDALFFIDLDAFKQVNDTLGHATGDEVLVATADQIRDLFRESDVLGRFGGDEFVVFAPGLNKTSAIQRAQRLIQALTFHLNTAHGAQIFVTASVGVYLAVQPFDLEFAIGRADEAMYHAKNLGKAQYYLTTELEEENHI